MKQACRSIFFLVLLVFLLAKPGQADIMLALENPAQNQKVTGIDVISGWAFSTIPGAKVRVRLLIDGTDIGDVPCCVDRADVAQQFGSQALNSGFGQGINFNILSAESHKIKVSVSDDSGSAAKEVEQTVTVIKPGGFEFLSQLDLSFATAAVNKTDQEIVLEKVQAFEKGTTKAQEVKLRLAWRQNTQTLGIVKSENVGSTTGAQSAQTLDAMPLQTEAADETAAITTTLENPVAQKAVSGISVVSGWTFPTTAGATISSVRLRVDGNPTMIALPCCFERADVQKAFPNQPQALRSGFSSPLNFNLLPSGSHTIGVEVKDSTGGLPQVVDAQVTAVRLGDSEFLDQFDLSGAEASIIGGQTLVLDKLKVRGKDTPVREIIADYAWQESCQCFVAQGVCGNGSIEPTEECDGATFADDEKCESLGFSGGTLTCRAETCELETKDCTGGPRVYVTNVLSNTVSVVSTATNAVTNTIAVGRQPRGVAVSPNGASAYVTNFADDTVSVIDTAANTVATTVALRTGQEKKGPLGIAFAPDGTKAYVVNGLENTVSVVNAATRSVTATMPVGKEPQAIVLSQDGSRAYVTNFADNSVTVLDTNTGAIVATVAVGAGPDGLALSPDGKKIYVANFDGDSLSVIDTATNKVVGDLLPLQFRPTKVVFAPDGVRAYVSNFLTTFQVGSIAVIVIETGTTKIKILSEFEALDNPDGLVMLPNGKRLYIALFGRNGSGQAIQVISPVANRTVAVVEVGRGPFAIAVQP